MMKLYLFFLAIVGTITWSCVATNEEDGFVRVDNGRFVLSGEDYTFTGTNYWQGMNLGAPVSGDRSRLVKELDHLQSLGIRNLRVLAASEADSSMRFCIHPALQTAPGVYDEDIWQGLDFLLDEMAKRNMKAVMVLGNFWTWSGGFAQYLKWCGQGEVPYPQDGHNWNEFSDYSKQFYFDADAQAMMNEHISKVITRKNTISGKLYKDDPTIMAWQLANEPRGYDVSEQFRLWTRNTSAYIKSLDTNHLVCLGTEGNTAGKAAGVNVLLDNDDPNIDYITMHIWAQNWGWFNPLQGDSVYNETLKKVDAYWNAHVEVATKLNKPIVLEEFGLARDSCSFTPSATTAWRDRYFGYLFSKVEASVKNGGKVRGVNFWSYSGTVRPSRPGEYWQKADLLIGDPPHELQGWYGVYDSDTTTLEMVKTFSERINVAVQ